MRDARFAPWTWTLCACALLPAGCAVAQGTVTAQQVSPPPPVTPPLCCKGIVFVANGSGNLHGTSDNLESAIKKAELPLTVERVAWSHSYWRPFWDLLDHDNLCTHSEQLAASILAYRQANPTDRIYLVGHSTGAAVILGAAERLPPATVDRIILLAPAVSASYDLRQALCATREGIDSFYCHIDEILSTFVMILGCADGKHDLPAGWIGFRTTLEAPGEECLYGHLRQHAWGLAMCKVGHVGGHWGCTRCGHLRDQVLPLLLGAVQPCSPLPPAAGPAAAGAPRGQETAATTTVRRVSASVPAPTLPETTPEPTVPTLAGLAAGYRPR